MNSELTLYDYWRIINRRKWAALTVFALTLASAYFYTKLQPFVYKSEAIIRFKPPASYSRIPGSGMTEWDPWGAVQTEKKIIHSIEISRRAEKKMKEFYVSRGKTPPLLNAGRIFGAYNAERVENSNLIRIYSTYTDPVVAANIVNAVISSYRDYDLQQKSRQAQKTLDDIAARKMEVEQNLRSLESRKKVFLQKNPGTGLGLAYASQLANFEIQKKELLKKYTPNHPEVLSVDEKMEVLEKRLNELPSSELELARITRELKMQEELYTILSKQLEEAKLGLASIVSFVAVVNPAMPKRNPVSPNMKLNMAVGILLGLFLAVVVIFVLENLDISITTIEDIENILKLPVLGLIPHIFSEKVMDNWLVNLFKKERYSAEAFRSVLLTNRRYTSQVIESYHTMRTNIFSHLGKKKGISLVFSSSGAAEGKTLTAINFALAAANSGLKSLLIDGDLRRPTIFNIFSTPPRPGMSNILSGEISWQDAVRKSQDFLKSGIGLDNVMKFKGIENFHAINCGTLSGNVIDILESADWDNLMGELKKEFDLIVFDSPPILLFVDTLMTARHTDGVVMVYKSGKIARGIIKRAKDQIVSSGVKMIGVVLNGVRASEMGPQYGYYYYNYDKYRPRS